MQHIYMDESTETSTKKRKRIEETPDEDNEIESSKDMPYHLNKLRALHKKLDSTAKDNSIANKGTPNNIQIVIVCNYYYSKYINFSQPTSY